MNPGSMDGGSAVSPRAYRPHCQRCGRQVEPRAQSSSGSVPLCATCSHAARSRCGGFTSHNYSPFRPLVGP
jgi:hypothetical protein